MKKTLFDKMLEDVPQIVKTLVSKQYDISEQIDSIRKSKGMTQKQLAEKMGKTESFISRVLSGTVNLTLKTIVELETALGEKILVTPIHEPKWESEIQVVVASGNVVAYDASPVFDISDTEDMVRVSTTQTQEIPLQLITNKPIMGLT